MQLLSVCLSLLRWGITHVNLKSQLLDFLIKNTGSIRVDVWSVGRNNYNGITYMPAHLAQNVIDNSVVAPSLAKIPNELDATNSFMVTWHAM